MTNFISTTSYIRDTYDDTLIRVAATELINDFRILPEDIDRDRLNAYLHGSVSMAAKVVDWLEKEMPSDLNEQWVYDILTNGQVEFSLENL